MGGQTFDCRATGKTAREAFAAAVREAQYDHGHGGYTGSIAEKREFVMISLPAGAKPSDEARKLIDADDSRVSDKWGPAGCFDLGGGTFYFFGWASS